MTQRKIKKKKKKRTMPRKTSGEIFTIGAKQRYYIRFAYKGKRYKKRLLSPEGKPITNRKMAQEAAERILAILHERDKLEQSRLLANNIRDAEGDVKQAEEAYEISKTAIQNGWEIYMTCPRRLKSCRKVNKTNGIPTTIDAYKRYYREMAEWMTTEAKRTLLSEITSDDAERYMDQKRDIMSNGSFNKRLTFLTCFFRTLIQDRKLFGENPFSRIFREDKTSHGKKPLPIGTIEKLLQETDGEMHCLIALGYYTGMRLGDCCTIKQKEIQLSRGILEHIPRKTSRYGQAIKIGIPEELKKILSEMPEKSEYVLPGMAEKYLNGSVSAISLAFQNLLRKIGISPVLEGTGKGTGRRAIVEYGFHSLRYSYISHHAESGTPFAIIQQNAGHSNPAMTEHYTKISDEAAKKYAENLNLRNESEEKKARSQLKLLADQLSFEEIQKILDLISGQRK